MENKRFQQGVAGLSRGFNGYRRGGAIYAGQIHLGQIGEGDHAAALLALRQDPALRGGVYAGVGGLLNLSYIAALQPERALLADVNPLQTLFWEIVIEKLAACPALPEFLSFLENCERDVKTALRERFAGACFSTKGGMTGLFSATALPDSPLQWEAAFFRGFSPKRWLAGGGGDHAWMTPENYGVLHHLAKSGKLAAATLDLLDETRCAAFGRLLAPENGQTGVLYASSIRRFLTGTGDWTGRRAGGATAETLDRNIALLIPASRRAVIEDYRVRRTGATARPELRF